MLRELRIENLLLIERAELALDAGLNVITGETGAGKTVLAHSLDLILGGKARDAIVRPGASEAWVEGTFDLPGSLPEGDPELEAILERIPAGSEEVTLGRRVSASGRTSAYIAGRSASAADLARLGSLLLAFYGQHQHRKLTIAAAQAEILDGVGDGRARAACRDYREHHATVRALEEEIESLRAGGAVRDLDLLRFELAEIEAANPSVEEEERLVEDRDRLRHVEGLRESAQRMLNLLTGDGLEASGAAELAAAAAEAPVAVKGVDRNLDEIATRTSDLALELNELGGEIGRFADGLEGDPERLVEVEERLEHLARLRRKHGGDIESVLAHAERCRQEIARLEKGEDRERELEAELASALDRRAESARELTAAREWAKAELEQRIGKELGELAMPGARLEVQLEPHPGGYGPAGVERIEFMLATNAGMSAAPLRDSASGGELSRVMLALSVAGEAAPGRVSVFDEIDAGIGGMTAGVVGEKLKRLGDAGQVVAITHLPQVAAQAAAHLRVEKDEGADPARANVERLEGDDVVAEITRMLGADTGDRAALDHARELVAASNSG